MTIELALLISVISVTFAIWQGVSTVRRNNRIDERSEAAQLTTVIVKLETINNGIVEIKSEMTNVKNDIKENRERIVKVEESAKSAHKRIDEIEKDCKDCKKER